MENKNINIIAHPTGRLLKKRDAYQFDMDKVLKKAKDTSTILEVDSHPKRLDLNGVNVKKAVGAGVKIIIDTDSHQKDQLRYMELGVAQARRGWAEKKDVINSYPLNEIKRYF